MSVEYKRLGHMRVFRFIELLRIEGCKSVGKSFFREGEKYDPQSREDTSMSTSILYHALGTRGYEYRSTAYKNGNMIFTIEQPRDRWECSQCGSKKLHSQGSVSRRFHALPWGPRKIFIDFDVPRVRCRDCGLVRQVKIEFAEQKRRTIKRLEHYVLDLLCSATVKDVARLTGLGWKTVREIEARHLHKKYAKPPLKDVKYLAIDELNIGRHHWVTIVLDLESGRVLHVDDGKNGATLDAFFKRLKASPAKVEAVAMDMSPAFHSAVLKHLPNAAIVFDHFHVVKLMNEKLAKLRRDLHREAKDMLAKDVIKGTRWLLLKRPEKLSDEPNKRYGGKSERERLDEALSLNKSLSVGYYLKEELAEFWKQAGPMNAEIFLDDWCARARASGIKVLNTMANTLQGYRTGLLTWFDHRISTGPLEGLNNKIGALQRQAYGFRNREYFKLKILAIHRSQYALVG